MNLRDHVWNAGKERMIARHSNSDKEKLIRGKLPKIRFGPLSPLAWRNDERILFPKTDRAALSPGPGLAGSLSFNFLEELANRHNSVKPGNLKVDPHLIKKESLSYYFKKLNTSGSIPESRSGSVLLSFDNYLFLYAGEKSDPSIDLHRLNYLTLTWEKLHYNSTEAPTAFRGQIGLSYKDLIIIYGGYDYYDHKLNIRSCSSSIYLYNTLSNTWRCLRIMGNGPEPRRNHAGCIVGDSLIIWSGQNSKGFYLPDISVLDLKTLAWVRHETNGDIPEPRIKSTLSPVFSGESKNMNNLSIFNRPDCDDHPYFGVYMFGGKLENGEVSNELFILRNKSIGKKLRFKALAWSLVETTGKRPLPRYEHTASNIGKYLIVFAGRNDKFLTPEMNDLHVLNIVDWSWVEVSLFGDVPSARFAAASTVLGNRIIVFGGRKLSGFVNMELFELETNQKRVFDYGVLKNL